MRARAAAALLTFFLLTFGRTAWAADPEPVDYTGWQIISTGTEVTKASYHMSLGDAVLDDQCTVVKRGTARYVIKKDPWGKGLERFSMDPVTASTSITVSGGGQMGPPVNERWSYKLGPSPYRKDVDSFSPSVGGAPQTSPDEPMFMPRTIMVSSYVPDSEWRPDPSDSPSPAQDEAIRAWSAAEEGDHPALEFVFPHRLDAQHLAASGHRAFSEETHPFPGVSTSCEIEVSYNVVVIPAAGDRQPPKVELQEIDRSWWPEEGNSLTATVSVTGDKPAKAFRFTLYDVSREPGSCGNSEAADTDPDLSLVPDQGGWSIEQEAEQWRATSDEGGLSASIVIACHDWGAWGKLKAEAKIEDQWEPAKVAGSGLDYVRIPYDDDDDHIADSWQALYGVGGKPPEDDSGKQPTDQANDGDGLSLYECYRGFNVLDAGGGSEHVLLDPRKKTLFVLDLSGYFEPGLWKQCSGITAYLVGETGCRIKTWTDASRLVNFRSANAKNGDKYCVVVTPIRGYKPGDDALGETGSKGGPIRSPADVDYCRVFPDVADAWLVEFAQRLANAYEHPDSADGRDFGDPKPGPDGTPTNPAAGLPRRMWKDAADRLQDPAVRQQLVAQQMRWTAIHEMGHACGLVGHVAPGDPNAVEIPIGNKTCPMCYSDHAADLQYVILQVLLKPDAALPMAYGRFCSDADYNCWGHLNVKDN